MSRPQAMHQNSLAAFRSEEPRLSKRAAAILDWITEAGPRTDRQVMQGMGFTDMNSVRPRITEAIDLGTLVEVGEKVCPVTHKTVRIVDLSLDEKMRRQVAA